MWFKSAGFTALHNTHELTLTLVDGRRATTVRDSWVVCNSLGAGKSRDLALRLGQAFARSTPADDADDEHLGFGGVYSPVAGVALHLLRDDRPAPALTGRLFCTLPLPTSNALHTTLTLSAVSGDLHRRH